mgnify:CR=1 FL=1
MRNKNINIILIFILIGLVFRQDFAYALRPPLQTNRLSKEVKDFLTEEEENKISPIIERIFADIDSARNLPYVVGVSGRAGAGKTEFLSPLIKIALKKKGRKVLVIGLDEFFKSPGERQSLGEWSEQHVRLQDAADFMAKVKRGEKSISRLKYARTPAGNMVVPDTVNLEGIDVVIFEGLYTINNEERLGNLLRFIDLSIYMEAREEDLKQWRFEQEARKSQPRSIEEMEKHWREGIMPDSEKNIISSRANAVFVVHIDKNHNISKIDSFVSKKDLEEVKLLPVPNNPPADGLLSGLRTLLTGI